MKQIKQNSLRAWILGIRPKTLTAAVIPVMIGSSFAAANHTFQWMPALACLLFAVLMQIDANLINDLFDYLKGSDREDRLGPDRVFAKGWITLKAMKRGIVVVAAVACIIGSILIFYGGWQLIFVGVACVLFAYMYTGGPYPLAYHGWGDVIVVLFFGLVPVVGTYYVQALDVTPGVVMAAIACGLVVDTMLVVNNYRDRETDVLSKKYTSVVRLGERFGRYLYLLLGIVAPLLCFCLLSEGKIWAAIFPLPFIVLHLQTWQSMVMINKGRDLNMILGYSSFNMLIFGLLLTIGLLLG